MSGYIAIEGIEGSGKSSLIESIENFFKTTNHELVVTREPGATELGKILRSIVLDHKNKNISELTELLLFSADRAEHIKHVIAPALNRNAFVLSDRSYFSTIAYQSYGRGLGLQPVSDLCDFVVGKTKPDLVILLDLDPELGLSRAKSRASDDKSSWTRFEATELGFHIRIREGFLELAKEKNNKFLVLDATKSKEELVNHALTAIKEKLLSE